MSLHSVSDPVRQVYEEAKERVRKNGVTKKWMLTQDNWKPEYTQILLLTNNGRSIDDIARCLVISKKVIYNVRSSTHFINKLAAMQARLIEKTVDKRAETVSKIDEARKVLTDAAVMAAKKVVKLGRSGDPEHRIQFDACRDILDRAGLRPVEVLETRERVYSIEEVSHAKAVLAETEQIITRLSNKSSPFVIANNDQGKLESSITDISSDDQQTAQEPSTESADPV